MEKWNELCFILSDSISPNISEQFFELKVIQAFEKLGWSHFKNEISVRESIQLGAANRIAPDIIIKSENQIIQNLKSEIKTTEYSDYLKDKLRTKLLNDYSIDIVEKVLEN